MPKFIETKGCLFKIEYVDDEYDFYDKKSWKTRYVVAIDMNDATKIVENSSSREISVMRAEELTSYASVNTSCINGLHEHDY